MPPGMSIRGLVCWEKYRNRDHTLRENMNKTLSTLMTVLLMTGAAQAVDTTRPNVILIMADDMGYGDPSYINGSVLKTDGMPHPDQDWIQTPNMDAMAAAGLRFDRFYSASAVCSPTRASCLTGRNPYRVGVPYANSGYMGADETPLSELLAAEGYATGHFGKWHLGTMTTLRNDANRGAPGNTSEYHAPWHFDYDECFATESKVPTYHPYRKEVNGLALPTAYTNDPTLGYTITDANFYGTHYWTMPTNPATADEGVIVPLDVVNNATDGDDSKLITDEAIDFIQQSVSNDTPFFVVLWYHTPHKPCVDPDGVSGVDSSDAGKDCIEDFDVAIGNLRTTLDTLGVRTNTMLWLTSDNGPEDGVNSPNEVDTARCIRSGGLRARKRSFYEGGIRVPGILEWPALISSGTNTTFLSSTSDYFPTILDYLGLSVPDQKALDGISLRPVIEGTLTERPSPIGFLIGGGENDKAWLSQDYKLVNFGSNWQLFDMTLPDHQLELTPLTTESTVGSAAPAVQVVYSNMLAEYTAWKTTVDADSAYTNSTTPSTVISSATSSSDVPFSVSIDFGAAVTGLSTNDFVVSGGTAGSLSGSNTSYTIQVTPDAPGTEISVYLPQAAAFATNGTPALPSNTLLVNESDTPAASPAGGIISNGDLNAAVPTAGSGLGSTAYTVDASDNVTEGGADIGRDTNQWVRSALTRGFAYSASGGSSGDGSFVQESSDTFNEKPRAVLQFAKDGKTTTGSAKIEMDVYFDDNDVDNDLYFNVELYAWNDGETAPALSTGGGTADTNSYNVTTLNDAVALLDNVQLAASDFSDATWTTATVSDSVALGGGYDYYAWRIGVVGASVGDNFAFENLEVSPQTGSINWGSAQDVTAVSDVSTTGALVEAFNAGTSSTADQTVNGVLFSGTGGLLSEPGAETSDLFSGDTGDSAYNALLGALDYGGGGNLFTNTVGGGSLTIGADYLVQVWFVDHRYDGTPNDVRTMQFGDGGGSTVELDSYPGQYVIGTFTATDTNQVLTYDAVNMGNAHVTAYQVREIVPQEPGVITWGSATAVSTSNDVSITGTLVEAYNAGSSTAGGTGSATTETVNGVTFVGTALLLPEDPPKSTDAYSGNTGDTAYNALLSSIDYGGGTDETLSLGAGSLAHVPQLRD